MFDGCCSTALGTSGSVVLELPKQGRKTPVLNQTLIDELDMPLEKQSNRLSTTQTGGQNHAGLEENDLEARPVHCALNLILFF